MKFELTTSASFYSKEAAEKLEKLGFTFEPYKGKWDSEGCMYKNGPKEPLTIKIATLGQLMAFVKKWGAIVLSADGIEIYDDYRE